MADVKEKNKGGRGWEDGGRSAFPIVPLAGHHLGGLGGAALKKLFGGRRRRRQYS